MTGMRRCAVTKAITPRRAPCGEAMISSLLDLSKAFDNVAEWTLSRQWIARNTRRPFSASLIVRQLKEQTLLYAQADGVY